MADKKKILYIQTSGPEKPESLYAPLILAQTARAMDIDATVYYLCGGLKNLFKKEAAKIKIGDFPTLLDVLKESASRGVRIMACQQSMQLFGDVVEDDELIEEAVVAGAATLNDLALEADAVLSF